LRTTLRVYFSVIGN